MTDDVLSQVSNVSTRAVVNSGWESSGSGANSRRSSSVDPPPAGGASAGHPQQGARIGQHLSRLHKKAHQEQQHLLQQQQVQHGDRVPGRQSVMSECNTNNPSSSPALSAYGGRRASDPVRVLDRNFGVGGNHHGMSRHRSGSYAAGQHQQNQTYQVCLCYLIKSGMKFLEV